MLKIVICVGSSCFVRGSERIAETFERLIAAYNLNDIVELTGAFCMDHCSMGVSIRVGDDIHSGIQPEDAETFFINEIITKIPRGVVA